MPGILPASCTSDSRSASRADLRVLGDEDQDDAAAHRGIHERPADGKRSLAGMPGLIPGAGPGWETALLVPVPAAEPAVSRHRARLDQAARDGVPAHITVLYPFLSPAGISEPLLALLAKLFAGTSAFEYT